ncbi:MAG: hypothetical protein JRH20_05840 [Deltaproteobacteria bacterium]|nr:hypothetical protein [Deltaproteobacteria bacterium]
MEATSSPMQRLKTLAIVVMLASAVAIPGWLYYKRGRKMPLSVVLEADGYVIEAGGTLTLSARISPADIELGESRWEGPGKASAQGTRLRWRAPEKPGIYTLRFLARRGATWAKDELSLQVLSRAPASYPLSSPPMPAAPPPITTLCPHPEATRFKVHGTPCRGERVVVELKTKAPWHRVWMASADKTTRGRFRALRLAKRKGVTSQMRATIVDAKAGCVHRFQTTILPEDCVGGPQRGALFADFHAELTNPGLFRLAAKPPRGEETRARYHWTLAGKQRSSDKPHLMHRFEHPARHYLVALEIEADGKRAKSVGLLTDRTFEGR